MTTLKAHVAGLRRAHSRLDPSPLKGKHVMQYAALLLLLLANPLYDALKSTRIFKMRVGSGHQPACPAHALRVLLASINPFHREGKRNGG